MAVPSESETYDELMMSLRTAADRARRLAMYHQEDKHDMWMKISSNLDRMCDHITKLHGAKVAAAFSTRRQ